MAEKGVEEQVLAMERLRLFGVNIYTSLPLALIAYLINEFIAPF